MAFAAHVFPNFMMALEGKNIALPGDTFKVQLIASSSPAYTWNATSEAVTDLTSFMAGSGGGALTEVSSTNYTAGGATFTPAISKTGVYTDITIATNPSWTNVTFNTTYAVWYDSSTATKYCICYWDFGGTQSVSGANFTLALGTSSGGVTQCLVEWTSN